MISRFFSVPKPVILLALFGTLLCVVINEINAHYLQSTIPNQFGLIHTGDEASYIAPARNFVNTGVWRDNSDGLTAYYQRPPGYGLLYALNYLILGKYAFVGVKIIQIMCFFIGILLYWKILKLLNLNSRWSYFSTFIFSVLPCYSGFVYFSITEGIIPFVVLWCIYELLKARAQNSPSIGLIISNVLLLLIRPQLAIIPIIGLFYFLLHRKIKVSSYLLLVFLPIICWYARTAYISKDMPSLHPIYSSSNNHLYRPTHGAVTDLYRVWEQRSDVFHSQIGRVAFGDSSQIELVVKELPIAYQEAMRPIFIRFQELNHYQNTHFKGQHLIHTFKGERQFLEDAKALKSELIAKNKLDYYIKTPLKSTKDFFNKSYLNLYIFQATFRGNTIVELLRILCWIVILISSILSFSLLFSLSWKSLEFAIVAGMAIFMFYLVFVQRLNEERYIVPILPILLIFGSVSLYQLVKVKSSKKVD